MKPERVGMAAVGRRDDPRAAEIAAFLQANGLDAVEWFAPRDLDELHDAVRAGRIGRVIFADLPALLAAVWGEVIDFAAWRERGVQVDLAAVPPADSAALVAQFWESWRAWRRAQRRRRTRAAIVLTCAALAAAFVLLWVV